MSKTQDIMDRYQKYVLPTYAPSLALVKGKGTRVWDAEGKVYLDFLAGISVVNAGHCHPKVVAAIQQQAATLMHVSNLYYTENQARLAERLSRLSMNGKCFFCNSGAEANEALIKLARLWGSPAKKFEVVTMQSSFHGRTLATLAATAQSKHQAGFEPMPEGFPFAAYNDIESVKAQVNDRTAAILLEAVQGEGGVVPADVEFLKAVRALCDERGILMLCDEVQCGLGRTGRWFGFQHAGITPDAFSLAKSLGNGFPIGAIVTSPKIADVFKPGTHASTFGGNPLACAAALAMLDVIEEEALVTRAAKIGASFQEQLSGFIGRYEHVKAVRGRGLMVGMVLDQPSKPFVTTLLEMGLIASATADTVVRFLPPLTVKESEIEEAVEIIGDALEQWHNPAAANA